jgi:tRNA(fMet)-specific endonuclease VapC
MTIIDTSVMIPFLNGSPEAVDRVSAMLNNGDAVITIITAYELLKGARLSSNPQENLKEVREVISNLRILDLSIESCEEASRIFGNLSQVGKMISEFDILIAAIAKINNEAILTRDQHFKFIEGIELTQW